MFHTFTKKGDKSSPANYRPISLTCILCEIFEHIVTSDVVKHLDSNQILHDIQYGFRSKGSCETQSTMLIEESLRNLKEGKQTDIILLDFSKAFDKVNPKSLSSNSTTMESEVEPYHLSRHSLMVGRRLWPWRGIAPKKYQ